MFAFRELGYNVCLKGTGLECLPLAFTSTVGNWARMFAFRELG